MAKWSIYSRWQCQEHTLISHDKSSQTLVHVRLKCHGQFVCRAKESSPRQRWTTDYTPSSLQTGQHNNIVIAVALRIPKLSSNSLTRQDNYGPGSGQILGVRVFRVTRAGYDTGITVRNSSIKRGELCKYTCNKRQLFIRVFSSTTLDLFPDWNCLIWRPGPIKRIEKLLWYRRPTWHRSNVSQNMDLLIT
jgi:hypothetical protein